MKDEAEKKAMELYPEWKAHSKKIDSLGVIVVIAERQAFLKGYEYANQQKPQAQYSTSQQIQELILIANKEGLYDAADFLRNANQQPEQDKVREASENSFNQARKQTSMLGEKDVQMTDYLISPKYKTFDDYWNSKKH